MKAIIPVAGIGNRLKPHTHTQPKSLIPVAGRPILGHIIENLRQSGIKEFVFIIGYLGDKIEQYVSTEFSDCKSTFVIQTLGKGVGHAIHLAKDEFADDEPILLVLGDTIFEADLSQVLNGEYSSLGTKKVDDPRKFGVAEIGENGFIKRLSEKPTIPKSNLALIGIYFIKETALLKECLAFNIENEIKTQNEFHLTDALECMINKGIKMRTFDVESWFDCGKKEIILQTNKNLLKRNYNSLIADKFSTNNIIVHPVYISPTAIVKDSIIGPDVSIGDGATIQRSVIQNSIIGPGAELQNAILENSLIGSDATLISAVQHLNLGDNAEINLRD